MTKKRPIGVWVISVWFIASLLWLSVSHYLIFSGKLPLTPQQQEHFNGLRLVDHFLIFFTSVYSAFAAIALFLRKPVTVALFQGLLAVVPLVWILDISRRGFAEVMGTGGPATLIAAILGYAIDIGIVVYVLHLRKKKYFL